jgi:hypothetical protein
VEYYDEKLNSRTLEKKARKFNGTETLVGKKSGDLLKNHVECAVLTISQELSWEKYLVCLQHTVYGTITKHRKPRINS